MTVVRDGVRGSERMPRTLRDPAGVDGGAGADVGTETTGALCWGRGGVTSAGGADMPTVADGEGGAARLRLRLSRMAIRASSPAARPNESPASGGAEMRVVSNTPDKRGRNPVGGDGRAGRAWGCGAGARGMPSRGAGRGDNGRAAEEEEEAGGALGGVEDESRKAAPGAGGRERGLSDMSPKRSSSEVSASGGDGDSLVARQDPPATRRNVPSPRSGEGEP
jgi:hypothetical protein